jgi:hypothetical protein
LLFALLVWTALGTAAVAVSATWPEERDPLLAASEQGPTIVALLVARLVGWVMLNGALLAVLLALLIVPHELGHVLGAWLAGLRVFLVQLGHGPLLGSVRFLGTTWQLRAFLDGGVTCTGHPDLRFFRRKLALMVLAGPLMNGLLLAAALWWRPPAELIDQLRRWPDEPGLLPLPVFVLANVVLLLLSLVPWRVRAARAVHTSDGLKLLRALFMTRAECEGPHALYFALEGGECLSGRRALDGLRWYERGLGLYPRSAVNELGASCALLTMRRYDEAERRLADLRAREDLDRGLEALVADTTASSALGRVIAARCRRRGDTGDEKADGAERLADLLEAGERWGLEALTSGSRLPPVQWSLMGTYACLLVEQGRLDEGTAILRLARDEVEAASERAYCLCYLAVVAVRQGRVPEARAALETARRLCPDHVALERAEWQLVQGA